MKIYNKGGSYYKIDATEQRHRKQGKFTKYDSVFATAIAYAGKAWDGILGYIKHGKGFNKEGKKNTYSISVQFDNVDKYPDGRSVYFKQNGEMVRRYVSEEQMNFWYNKGMM